MMTVKVRRLGGSQLHMLYLLKLCSMIATCICPKAVMTADSHVSTIFIYLHEQIRWARAS